MTIDNRKIFARFATAERAPATGPLAWGQRFIWDIITSLAPCDEHLNLTLIVPVPPGLSTNNAMKAVAALIERHASLRTMFFVGDDREPCQIEINSAELELKISVIGEDLEQSVTELAETLAGRSFNLTRELPIRAGICVQEGMARVIVLAFSHIVADAWAIRIMRSDMERFLSGGSDVDETSGYRPIERAAFENSESGRLIEAAALTHWRSRLRQFPRTMFAMHPMTSASPRYWKGELWSPALGLGMTALMKRYRVSSNSVLLAALSLYIGYLMRIDYCALNVQVGNRIGRDLKRAVGTLFQEVPVVFNVDQRCFEKTARSAQAEVIRAARHARCSPAKVRNLIDEIDKERGTRTTIDTMVNTIQMTANAPAPALPESPHDLMAELAHLRAKTEFSWTDKREVEGVKLQVISALPVESWISLLVDTSYLPPDCVHALLLGIEELIIRVAIDGDEPSAPICESGLTPFPRGPEWLKLSASWTDVEATATMIAGCSGLGRDAVHLAVGNDRLIAYIADQLPIDKFRSLPGECFEALARDETVALPDYFVLLEKFPPPGPSPDGWRHQPVKETATLRRC